MVYDIKNLLHYYSSPYSKNHRTKKQIICDIDKTYLETQTSSFLDLAKTALEKPEHKKTIFGAREFLDALLWNNPEKNELEGCLEKLPQNLHFVSASPPQLRHKLEEKFLLDRLYWTSITLKNQLYNIKKIKFKLLREQISYKTLAILNIIEKNPNSSFFLIGDNSESDPYIYSGLKLLKDGSLSHKGYMDFLEMAGLTKSSIKTIVQNKGFLKPAKILNIFIRDTKDGKTSSLDPYLIKFRSYKNLFLYSYKMNYLSNHILQSFIKTFYKKKLTDKGQPTKQETLYRDLRESYFEDEEAKYFIEKIDKKTSFKYEQKPRNLTKISEAKFLLDARNWFEEKK